METLDGNRQLIHKWEVGGMEDDVGDAEGLHQRKIQALLQKQKRLQWILSVSLAALLLLFAGSLVLFVADGRGGPCTEHCQDKGPTESPSPGRTMKQAAGKPVRPIAFLTVPSGENRSNGTVLLWERSMDHAQIKGGFRYNNGKLKVPKMGFYRVLLQITYDCMNPGCLDGSYTYLSEVMRESPTYPTPRILVKMVETMSVIENTPWRKSIYTSGMFNLEESDELYVTSNKTQCITREQYEVFFGVELLD